MNTGTKQRNHELARNLLSAQNFSAAVIVGTVAALLAAVAYGLVTSRWGFSYGFSAAGIGIVVGISMQYLGRGIDTRFAVAASLLTIAGCIVGNLFRVAWGRVGEFAASPSDVFSSHTFPELVSRAVANVSPVDFVFWFVAVWFAVFLVKRPLSREERLAIGTYRLKGNIKQA